MEDIRLTAMAGDQRLGPFRVAPVGEVLLGRAAVAGLALEEDWAPRVLATLIPTDRCWLVVNGPSARIRVGNEWTSSKFPKESVVALPLGVTELRWPALDDHAIVRLNVGGLVEESLPVLRPETMEVEECQAAGMRTAFGRLRGAGLLEPRQRHAMAVLFRHLLEGEPRLKNIRKPAAHELGITEDALQKTIARVRERVNKERFQKIRSIDELGEYLVEAACAVSKADLHPLDAASATRARMAEGVRRSSPRGRRQEGG